MDLQCTVVVATVLLTSERPNAGVEASATGHLHPTAASMLSLPVTIVISHSAITQAPGSATRWAR